MQSELNAGHYTDPAIFSREQHAIFRRLWLFAGFRSALAEPNAFVTRTLGGLPVLLQNCDGDIRAFSNQCPHRLMPIQTEPLGQARMVCAYHGWTFGHDGAVKSIPSESRLYQFDAGERKTLCLKRYAVEVVGNLVFVNLAADPLPIEQQFSQELLQQLRDMSGHFGAQAVHVDVAARYNWKLNYENVLDYNHIPYIHPKTFLPLMDKQKHVASDPPPEYPSIPATLAAQSFASRMPLAVNRFPWHDMVQRYGEGDYYYNVFLFPNVNFISVGGLVFLVQQFDPLAPDHTRVRFTLTAAKETQRIAALPAILRGHLRSEVDVLYEDLGHLEALQANMHQDSPRVQHGKYEQRLTSFARVYAELLEGGSPW